MPKQKLEDINMVFYNENGKPIAYCEDGEHIYMFSGEPVAYFYEDKVYNFAGKHIGWFIDGWIRDLKGDCIFFTDNAGGGPFKPFKQFCPFKAFKQFMPFKSFREFPHCKPFKSTIRSVLNELEFF